MSGANFFLSVKQLIDAEKKLRIQHKLLSALKIAEAEGSVVGKVLRINYMYMK